MVELIITVISYEKSTHYVQTERPLYEKQESNPQKGIISHFVFPFVSILRNWSRASIKGYF